ncbi:sperm-associated antigen 6-like isoform X2 [Ceratina calcarata]|uniref:Sperm-associated antigen 6-like isoform X2 n=1 Tax=Ceratina calcarata TaxID=156304 RepID=A0AAJ7N9P4_9HYME|nr:sperm-associated antigen 6-like isoform X2 [Ceratina calcarata]
MTARSILQVFDQYQKARLFFVQSIADFASKSNTVECLEAAGVLDLLSPLLTDPVPSIRHMAAIALGKIANNNSRLAQAVVRMDILPQLLKNISKQNKFYKKAAVFVLRAIAKHSPELASMVIQSNGLETIIVCLEDFDSGVKEAAAWGLGYIARHNKNLAQATVDAGAVPLLVLCLQEPELCLKQIGASALYDISKHNNELAENVVDAGAIPFLAKALSNPDTKLKRQVLLALSSIAKHSVNLAESIIEAEILPDVLVHMAHPDECVVKAAAMLTREISKHTLEMAQLIVNIGGIGALVELICTAKLTARLPAIMAIGYIAGHSDQLAVAVIGSKAIVHLSTILHDEEEEQRQRHQQQQQGDDHTLAVTVWAIGQIGKHTSEHAKAVAVAADVLPKLLQLYNSPNTSEDLKAKCNLTLKQVLQRCMHIEALEPLLHDSPPNILKYVLGQFSKILPHDARARRLFVTSGGLKKVQEIQADPGSTLLEYIQIINCCFPEEIVRYYSPGYPSSLLEAVEQYQPKCPSLFAMEEHLPSDIDSKSSLSSFNEEG